MSDPSGRISIARIVERWGKMSRIKSFREAEHRAVEQLWKWGRDDAKVTTAGADGGIDIAGKDLIGQVKWQKAKVGRPELQRLFGARGARQHLMVFFSLSGYSQLAIDYADSVGMLLFVYGPTGKARHANRLAEKFISRSVREVAAKKQAKADKKQAKADKNREKMLAQQRALDEAAEQARRLEEARAELEAENRRKRAKANFDEAARRVGAASTRLTNSVPASPALRCGKPSQTS